MYSTFVLFIWSVTLMFSVTLYNNGRWDLGGICSCYFLKISSILYITVGDHSQA